MKRFHIHIAVNSIDESSAFYSKLFGQAPSVQKEDYAKWMLDDPRVNFAISQRPARAGNPGLDHLGFQFESSAELDAASQRLAASQIHIEGRGQTSCCYAGSDKGWLQDPQGIAWESFVTFGSETTYGTEDATRMAQAAARPAPNKDFENAGNSASSNACCVPAQSSPSQLVMQAMAKESKLSSSDAQCC